MFHAPGNSPCNRVNYEMGILKMIENNLKKDAFSLAYSRWFSEYEAERKKRRRRRGAKLVDFPPPPTSPDEVIAAVDAIGRKRVLAVFDIDRTTLSRWMTGRVVIPRSAWLLMAIMRDGLIPGMSDDWRQFRFDGDRLCLVGTRYSYTAREISGWPYQQALIASLQRRIAQLERDRLHLLQVGDFGAANDALMAM